MACTTIPAISIKKPRPPRKTWILIPNGTKTAKSMEMKPSTMSIEAGLSAITCITLVMASTISDKYPFHLKISKANQRLNSLNRDDLRCICLLTESKLSEYIWSKRKKRSLGEISFES
jgi:hypothetical protein